MRTVLLRQLQNSGANFLRFLTRTIANGAEVELDGLEIDGLPHNKWTKDWLGWDGKVTIKPHGKIRIRPLKEK